MAIEDHPKYVEWRRAIDHLLGACERRAEAEIEKRPKSELDRWAQDVEKAKKEYREVLDDLDQEPPKNT